MADSSPDSPSLDSSPELEGGIDPRHSSFKLSILVSVGYQRHRSLKASKFEANVTSLVLLIAGVVLVLLIFWRLSLIQL